MTIGDRWRALDASRRRLFAGVVVLAAAVLVGGAAAIVSLGGAAAPTPLPSPSEAALASSSPSPTPSATPALSPSPTPQPTPDPVLGTDGRLTVLLLGSDYRPAHPGNRTDSIMVVSVDPQTGATAAASIPRDTIRFPLLDGTTYAPKVNALYQHLIATDGLAAAGPEMEQIVGQALGVEIDSYVFIGFEGVRQLVNAVGGVDVTLTRAVSDPYYWVTSTKQGVYFPAGVNHLNGDRALIFARTRKGDNDFERSRRQQLLVAAAIDAVRSRGLGRLPALIDVARKYIRTDLPLDGAARIYAMVAGADLAHADKVVLGPNTYESAAGGTDYVLKLDRVRAWIAKAMAPAAPPAPSPSAGG